MHTVQLAAAAFQQLVEYGHQPAAGGVNHGGGIGDHLVRVAMPVEFDAVEFGAALREQVKIGNGEDGFAAQILHAFPAAQHGAHHVQSGLQNRHGAGDGDEEAGRHRHEQGSGQNLHAHAQAVEHSGKHGNADADQQAQHRVNGLHHLGGGHFVIGIHEVGNLALLTEQTVLAFIIVFHPYNAMQADGLAHGVHLGHFSVVLLQSGPHGHGHFQTEGGTAGHPQLLQAENAVDEAGGEGQRQQGIHREAALQKVAQTVQHQIAAQQGGNQHCQHLAEDHQLHPVFRHQIQGEHGGNAGADEHHQHIDQQRGL